ncbi:hypothetical protein D7Y04_28650 [Corallococcus sp. AB038B]|nr:hypothetical protein D7Y04_28650 [Corallococcus sp. AB038B]
MNIRCRTSIVWRMSEFFLNHLEWRSSALASPSELYPEPDARPLSIPAINITRSEDKEFKLRG